MKKKKKEETQLARFDIESPFFFLFAHGNSVPHRIYWFVKDT